MDILKLMPVPRETMWGGERLCEHFGIECSEEQDSSRIGEAWMLSCHPNARSRVVGGEFDGKSLPEVLTKHPEYMGSDAKRFNRFPLMIKLIDARENLSIQVHPDDEYAADTHDAQGKTELWYVIEAEPDAEIIYGFRQELTQEQFRAALQDDTILDKVEHFKVKSGDVFFLEAGTVHSIGKGVLLCEIQQNSTTEYRVYDYGRTDEEGISRPTQIEKAIDVAITVPPTVPPGPLSAPVEVDNRTEMALGECNYFRSVVMDTYLPTHFEVTDESFASVVVIEGEAKFYTEDDGLTLKKGESALIPAGAGRITVDGRAIFIVTTI